MPFNTPMPWCVSHLESWRKELPTEQEQRGYCVKGVLESLTQEQVEVLGEIITIIIFLFSTLMQGL